MRTCAQGLLIFAGLRERARQGGVGARNAFLRNAGGDVVRK